MHGIPSLCTCRRATCSQSPTSSAVSNVFGASSPNAALGMASRGMLHVPSSRESLDQLGGSRLANDHLWVGFASDATAGEAADCESVARVYLSRLPGSHYEALCQNVCHSATGGKTCIRKRGSARIGTGGGDGAARRGARANDLGADRGIPRCAQWALRRVLRRRYGNLLSREGHASRAPAAPQRRARLYRFGAGIS